MIGQMLGHYRIIERIGVGGMGEVYRAKDERLERDVALKVLPAGTLADEAARKRFRKEALALAKLNHPNIGVVHDFDRQDGVDFLVMEYIAGATLAERIAAGALPEKEVLALGAQIAAPDYFAMIYAGLGEKEQALAWLREAFDQHAAALTYIQCTQEFDLLRSDPRFQDLLRRIGLPQ